MCSVLFSLQAVRERAAQVLRDMAGWPDVAFMA